MVVTMVVKNRGPDLYGHGLGVANRPGAERDDVSKGRGWMTRVSRSRPTWIRPRRRGGRTSAMDSAALPSPPLLPALQLPVPRYGVRGGSFLYDCAGQPAQRPTADDTG